MEHREDWRRRQREDRESESFSNRERDYRNRERDYESGRDLAPGRYETGSSWGGWSVPVGSPSGIYPEAQRWSDVPRGRFTGRGPKNYRRSSERIREDVCERLAQNADLDASEIEIHVEDLEVTLEGKVEDRRSKRLAEDLAESVAGVRDVHNHLKVEEGLFAGLFGRSEKDYRRDDDRSRKIPIAPETGRTDRPGGSVAVTAVADTAVTGTDRTSAVSDTTPPSSASQTRPRT